MSYICPLIKRVEDFSFIFLLFILGICKNPSVGVYEVMDYQRKKKGMKRGGKKKKLQPWQNFEKEEKNKKQRTKIR